jgi:hypothetical protein
MFTKENSILLEGNEEFFILLLEDENQKNEALQIILNGGVVDEFGYSEDISKEEFEKYKNEGFIVVKYK